MRTDVRCWGRGQWARHGRGISGEHGIGKDRHGDRLHPSQSSTENIESDGRKKNYIHRCILQNTIEERIDAIKIERQEMQFESDHQDHRKHSIKGGRVGGFDASELYQLLV